jgi:proteasome lid subunit RPN8/RPN11
MREIGEGTTTRQRRMVGRVRQVELPLLCAIPDPVKYREHTTADGRRVFIHERVFSDLDELERNHHPDETAGLLFGGLFTDGQNSCTVVKRLIKPERGEVEGTPSSVTITAFGAERMTARARLHDPLLTPVGWGHTHPCFDAYFSAVDEDEQRAWQQAGSVGLVLSGLRRPRTRYCVFVGPQSTPADPPPRASENTRETTNPRTPVVHVHKPATYASRRFESRRLKVCLIAAAVFAALAVAISLYALTTARDAGRQAREALSNRSVAAVIGSSSASGPGNSGASVALQPPQLRLRSRATGEGGFVADRIREWLVGARTREVEQP